MSSSGTPRDEPAKGSKRIGMSRLPRDWRQRLFEVIQARKRTKPGKLAEAVAVLWCTGCRPSELELGVTYARYKGHLALRIQGSKHGQVTNGVQISDRGLEYRILVVNPMLHAGAAYLYDLADPAAGPAQRRIQYNKGSIRSRVGEAGREVLSVLKDPPSISPYTFRHAMASDLKSCDAMTDEQRAQVMGHLSVESLDSYGRRRRGGGGVAPVLMVKTPVQPRGTRSHAPPDLRTVAEKWRQRAET